MKSFELPDSNKIILITYLCGHETWIQIKLIFQGGNFSIILAWRDDPFESACRSYLGLE